jgi:hypothetical protein
VDVGLVRGLARADNGRQPSPENEAPASQVGLGLAIEIADEGCTVLNTVVGGGAHSCGKISTGDLLIAVLDRARSSDFVSTAGMDFNQVRNMILGAPGSRVTLKLQQSRQKGGTVYICEDLVRGTQVDQLNSPQPKAAPSPAAAKPAPAAVRAPPPLPAGDAARTPSPPMPPVPSQAVEGVGIVLDVDPDAHHPVVVSLVPGKAADGCKRIGVGDKLVAVAGQATSGKTFNEVRDLIVGPVGSTVSLNFQGPAGAYQVDLVRGSTGFTEPEFDAPAVAQVTPARRPPPRAGLAGLTTRFGSRGTCSRSRGPTPPPCRTIKRWTPRRRRRRSCR